MNVKGIKEEIKLASYAATFEGRDGRCGRGVGIEPAEMCVLPGANYDERFRPHLLYLKCAGCGSDT